MSSYHDNRDRDSRYNPRYRGDRINEDDVPESKHTIFIRGLPGSMSTDEIKDFFEDKVGPVSFDFVKTSPDNVRLFVAVRFETREDAKKAMNQFADHDLLGHRCDLSWFKDIRRFAEYQKAQGIISGRGRGGYRGRGSYRGGYRGDYRRSRDRRSRERSRSRSSHSRSRSASRSDSERSRSARRSRSRSERRRSSSRENRRSTSRESANDSDYRRKDKRRRSRRSVSKHSNISSDGDENKGEDSRSPSPVPAPPVNNPPPPTIKVSIKTTKEDLPEIPAPVPPPAIDSVPMVMSSTPTPVPPPSAPSVDQLKTSFSIGMDTVEPKIIQRTENKETVLLGGEQSQERQYGASHQPPPPPPTSQHTPHQEQRGLTRINGDHSDEPHHKMPRMAAGREEPIPYPPAPASQYQMNANPYNSWTPVENKTNRNDSPAKQKYEQDNGFGYKVSSIDGTKFPIQSSLFADVRQYQEQMISSVKAAPKEESLGSFSLSSLSAGMEDNEMEKKCNREQRLSRMSEIELERFQIHKRKLENAFKGDCSTFTIVTKKLLMKDPTLEKQLRMCLIETMEDLEKQMFEKIDDYLGI